MTALLLLTISYLGAPSGSTDAVVSLALAPQFVKSISTYLGHLDPSIRRCGMLVAEEVARTSGKKLDFGDWTGDADGRAWCRSLRLLLRERDVDSEISETNYRNDCGSVEEKEVTDFQIPTISGSYSKTDANESKKSRTISEDSGGYDSDDSLTGYVSSPSSSRSPSPTPSELVEIEKDPTLRVTQAKVPRPVYLAQLAEVLRPTTTKKADEEDIQAQKQEVALNVAEELIRKKRSYGTELGKYYMMFYSYVSPNHFSSHRGKCRQSRVWASRAPK